jgi:hypothetical protein
MHLNYIPNIDYQFDANTRMRIGNLIRRFKFDPKAQLDRALFLEYQVRDGDTPQSLADSLYGHPREDWIIYMINDIIDPAYGWVLSYNVLMEYCKLKYDDMYAIHHYEDKDGDEVDQFAIGSRAVTNFDYELGRNEAKRKIKVLDPAYFTWIKREAIGMFAETN